MSKKHRGQFEGEPHTYALPSPAGGVQMETFVPWRLVKRGCRKQIITPLNAPRAFTSETPPGKTPQDSPLVRALGLAHYWQRLLDEERLTSLADIAEAEDMEITQVRRILRLTLLAPDVVESLADHPEVSLDPFMRRGWSLMWSEQGEALPN
ncbi:MAG: hypothetical protein ACRDD3_10575 [Azovibrio sp.]